MASDPATMPADTLPHDATAHRTSVAPLALAALGVVYGDIGTSPLYALKECFAPHAGLAPTTVNVLGVLSLFFWALTLVIVLKYLTFIMRADNHGEGGILALLALLRPDRLRTSALVSLGMFGAALLYGDGVITPAISVLSAMEGLSVATPRLEPLVVPLTCVILAALFVAQKRGTAGIGAVFGPATLVWFVAIAAGGLHWVLTNPGVLRAVSPWYALHFFVEHGRHGFLLLGAVVLCITGGEALYADMGHFGRQPIRVAWYAVVMPALLLNYFGQGAMLLARCQGAADSATCQASVDNPFYAILPDSLVYPMIIIATVATVVASQALISGAFSLTQQAVQLGFAPRVQIRHTSPTTEGQIYVPVVNWTLMVSCIALVLATASSSKLAAAYGIAVTGTMAITSVLFYAVARRRWRWPRWRAGALVGLFLAVDLAFFTANVAKFFHGGWFPIVMALGIFMLMSTWKLGGLWRSQEFQNTRVRFEDFLQGLKVAPPVRVKGTAVFMTQDREGTPPALLHHLKHNQVLHEQLVILTIETRAEPIVPRDRRIELVQLGHGFWRVLAYYGFMETPNVPEVMRQAAAAGLATVRGRTSYYLGRETFVPTGRSKIPRWRKALFVFMARNARSPTDFFGIPPNDVVELGAQIQI
jgi:KUP system potassium uptake protein